MQKLKLMQTTLYAHKKGYGKINWRRYLMMQRLEKSSLKTILTSLALLLTGCANNLPCPTVNYTPQVPPLPGYAQQEPLTESCKPSCAAGLSSELKNWQTLLTETDRKD